MSEPLVEPGVRVAAIAARLHRHRTTISGEVNRNGGRPAHAASAAQDRADAERTQTKVPKLVADPGLAVHVTIRLEAKDSPMTISRELASGAHGLVGSISHECIYSRSTRTRPPGSATRSARGPTPAAAVPQEQGVVPQVVT